MNWKYKVLLIIVAVVLILPILAYFVLQSNHVQTYITDRLTRQLSEQFNTEFRIERVDIKLFRSVVLEGVYLEDQQNDTLLHASALNAEVETIRPLRRQIRLSSIKLDEPKVRLRQDSSYRNFDFLLKALTSDTASQETGNGFSIYCNDFVLANAKISYRSPGHDSISGFDLKNFSLTKVNMEISDIQTGDTTHFNVDNFSLRNKSSTNINSLLFKAHITPDNKRIEDLVLLTDRSNLILKEFFWRQKQDTAGGFLQNNRLLARVGEGSFISGREISKFLPDTFPDIKDLQLSGTLGLQADSAHADALKILYGGANVLAANGFVKNFTAEKGPEADITIEQLLLQSKDLMTALSDFLPDSLMQSLEPLRESDFLEFKGQFAGNPYDMRIDGKLRTQEGTLNSRLEIRRKQSGSLKALDGQLSIKNLHAGTFLRQPDLGRISLETKFRGLQLKKHNSSGKFNLHLKHAEYQQNSFENLQINGELEGEQLNIQAFMADTSLRFRLKSRVLLEEIPVYRFSLKVARMDFVKTALDKNADLSRLKFNMSAYLKGKSPENLSGSVQITDALFRRDTSRITMPKMTLDARQSAFQQKSVTMKSPFGNLKVNGHFDYNRLPQTLRYYLHGIFPRAISTKETDQELKGTKQHVRYNLVFKKINKLLRIFRLNSSIAPQTHISGDFSNQKQVLTLNIESNKLNLFGNEIKELKLKSNGRDNNMHIGMQTTHVKGADRATFHRLGLEILAQNDSIRLQTQWNNPETAPHDYRGKIRMTAYFRELARQEGLQLKMNLHPSFFVVADSMWSIDPTLISVKPSHIEVEAFEISHKNEYIGIGGSISSSNKDTLHLAFNHYNLSNLNILLLSTDVRFGGRLQGDIALTNVFESPYISIHQEIKQLAFNNNILGNMSLDAGYSASDETMNLNMFIQEKSIKNFVLKGNYQTNLDSLNFNLYMKNLSLRMFNPLLEGTVSNIAGLASTQNIQITGSTQKPVVKGALFLQKAGFKIDYLNTQYTFTDSVRFEKNKIHFVNFELHDNRNNTGLVNGSINHDFYRNFAFNLTAQLNELKALNTTSEHNEDFYGEAYASGLINISGPMNDMVINVSATTEPDTRFFVPMTSGGEINESSFISFASDTSANEVAEAVPQAIESDVSGVQLNFDLEVTPEASIALILNENTDDVLRSRGQGALRLVIDTRGMFNMYGDYNIQEGAYIFSLQNVMERHFEIKEGSTIKWDGNPYNAQLAITTTYTVGNALLYDLTLQDKYKETRVPAQCIIELDNQLTNPQIDFSVEIADSYQGYAETDQIEAQLSNLSQAELNKQFLSLLVINRFQPLPGFSSNRSNLASNTSMGLSNSASELLTNQLSSWISEISEDVNVGINYNTSDSISSSELEVALSTQLLNDRVRINGNLSMGDQYTNPENYFGNFDVEYKITQNGKLRVKYYNKANKDLIYNEAPNKQGLGVFYREEFDTFSSLLKRYKTSVQSFWNKLFNKDNKKGNN